MQARLRRHTTDPTVTRVVNKLRLSGRNTVANLILGFEKTIREAKPNKGQLLTAVLTIASSIVEEMPLGTEGNKKFDQLRETLSNTSMTLLLSELSCDKQAAEHTS